MTDDNFCLRRRQACLDEESGKQVPGGNVHGVRISPFVRLYNMQARDDEAGTWLALAGEIGGRNIACVHLSYQRTLDADCETSFLAHFREAYAGTLIVPGSLGVSIMLLLLIRHSTDSNCRIPPAPPS